MDSTRSTLIAAMVTVAACSPSVTTTSAPTKTDFLRANIDTTVDPGQDFFQYANGGWLKRNPIPNSESAWGIGNIVREQLYLNLRSINEQAGGAANAAGTDQQKIGDFWATAMDTAKAELLGIHPLDAELARIDAIKSANDALDVAFALNPLQVGPFFSFYVYQDERKSDMMSVHLSQGGLGLPDRDFYVNPDSGVARIRTEYVAHLGRTLKMLGRNDAESKTAAANVMAFETALAKASRKLEDLRDPVANYNKMTPAQLTSKYTPAINWAERLAVWNLRPDSVVVGQPEFFTALQSLIQSTPAPVLQDYLRFQLVSQYSPYLSNALYAERFSFYNRVLNGQKEPRLRWKRVLDAEGDAMGMVLGRIFVKEYFGPVAKKRYADMVEAIRTAYRERINRLDWMSDSTKARALQKLGSVYPKVGYPDKWKDYSALVVGRNSYAENMMNAARWGFNDMISKFGKPVDRTEWGMTPQTYNAYYNPSNNEIVLPAAIFTVPGVSDAGVDDAVAYGYAAAGTIGHEITHGFDDEGRQFDAAGNLTDWWTSTDATKFQQRAAVMQQQFDAYEPIPGMHINGKASLGENIADYGGVLLGLDAFKKTAQYKEGKEIGGLTPLQRYFLGYALGWMTQQREESLRVRLLSDVHAPAKWR
ncbi:MAG TPA: M13 family metallopeptidase, partial [Gemmatimonadaceae bacterium]|nr:M13 family metallopeptidase [Gemmatimonadaceae bacterium]